MNEDDRWAGMSAAEIEAVMVDRFWRSMRGEAFTPNPAALREQIVARLVPLGPAVEPKPKPGPVAPEPRVLAEARAIVEETGFDGVDDAERWT